MLHAFLVSAGQLKQEVLVLLDKPLSLQELFVAGQERDFGKEAIVKALCSLLRCGLIALS